MTFNSFEFAVFIVCVFLIYWFVLQKNLKAQNSFILISSYIFFGWWDWRFLSLIAFSSLVDYLVGLGLSRETEKEKRLILLLASIFTNVGLLGFFKYYNFFVDSFADAFALFGRTIDAPFLDIILPIGISFYTLQTLSYTIDVYDKKISATSDFVVFFAYVSFFPQLVAGPIERAKNLIPQFQKKRVFDPDQATDGMRQILWGLFKKVLIADNIGLFVHDGFTNFGDHSGSTLLVAMFLNIIQFYCDFSGYSDIAIGTARLLGFNLMKNFDYPFFARNMSELWQKWHISLLTWFRDYIISRLKGVRKWKIMRNIFIIFLITGIWHGANWTYVLWGVLNALFFVPLILYGRKRYKKSIAKGRLLPNVFEIFAMLRTFFLFCFAGVFFRIDNISNGFGYLSKILSSSVFSVPQLPPTKVLALIGAMLIVEWLQRDKEHGLELIGNRLPVPVRWGLYYALIIGLFYIGGVQQTFIYFQF